MSTQYRRKSPRWHAKDSQARPAKRRRFDYPSLTMLHPRMLLGGQSRRRRHRKAGSRRGITHVLSAKRWHLSHGFALIMICITVAALVAAFSLDQFYVYDADILQNRYTDRDDIYRQSDIHGYSVFFVNPRRVAQNLAQLPHVAAAKIQVRLPDTIRITVEERVPSILYQVQGSSYWIDESGYIAPAVEEKPGLIKLIDDDSRISENGRYVNQGLVNTIRSISAAQPQITTFRYQPPYGLYFISPEGWRVYLGDIDAVESKLAIWQQLRQTVLRNNQTVQEIDLRFELPYIR